MSKTNTSSNKRVPRWERIIPCAVGLLILIIIAAVLIRMLIWNRGKVSVINPDEVPDVDVETEDMLYLMPPSTVWGDNDDGVVNIVMFGNDTLHTSYKGKTIADLIGEKLDVNIYNISFPGSYLTSETDSIFDPEEYPVNAFSFYWLQYGFLLRDYSMQEEALQYLPEEYDRKDYEKTLELLKSIDFNEMDILMFAYDGHDYLNERPPMVLDEVYNIKSMQGSIAASIFNMEQNFPNMQYVYITPIFCYYIDGNGNREACDIKNLGQGNMPTGLTAIHNLDVLYSLSYVDLFYGSRITYENADEYLLSDGITPNEKGIQVMADRIVRMIEGRLFVEDK